MTSKPHLLLLTAIFASLVLSVTSQADSFTGDAKVIVNIEKTALEKWSTGDVTGYLDILSDDVTYFDDENEMKLEGLDAVKAYILPFNGQFSIPKYKFENIDVKTFGNAAVLSYNLFNYDQEGKQTHLWKCTEVYVKNEDNKWQVAHAHWSCVKRK